MKHDYRNDAWEALDRAKHELESNDPGRLKYAALELRMAMEALTYDRAQAYADEIPPTEYDTWQPRKLLMLLLEIDPYADGDSIVHMGIEEEYGKPAKEMKPVGAEEVLNLSVLRRFYDALSARLHVPTPRQLQKPQTLPRPWLFFRISANSS